MDDSLLASLQAAIAARPDDVVLRTHVASLLLQAGRTDEAVAQLSDALRVDPANAAARTLMLQALGGAPAVAPASGNGPALADEPEPPQDGAPRRARQENPTDAASADHVEPSLEGPQQVSAGHTEPERVAVGGDGIDPADDLGAWEIEMSPVTLRDVGGMTAVKQRLDMAFLAPMRNPQFRELYGKSLNGGLLLWGPPGCGKTFIAKAIAGEVGARFLAIGMNDVLGMWLGESEKGMHRLFEEARRNAPIVVFLDELDALGGKRSAMRSDGLRSTITQLLIELDGVNSHNDGVFVLGATNMPWDIDPALRRPGRFDRSVLVLPPDPPARESILAYHFRDRPTERLDIGQIARRTDGFSGADLAHLVDSAAEFAMMDSLRSGTMRPVTMADVERALRDVRTSIGPWLDTARNVLDFGSPDPSYDELRAYLKSRKR